MDVACQRRQAAEIVVAVGLEQAYHQSVELAAVVAVVVAVVAAVDLFIFKKNKQKNIYFLDLLGSVWVDSQNSIIFRDFKEVFLPSIHLPEWCGAIS